jgi:outer membrane protein OmpA-like peptidoglycan-associated protein
LGRFDIFKTTLKELKPQSSPQNLGFPVNTYGDQTGLTINTRGNRAYYSAEYLGGFGRKDIYRFEIPQTLRPTPAVFVKGVVYDSKSLKKLASNFVLINVKSQDTVYIGRTNELDGQFLLVIPVNENYALNIGKHGYLFRSENFSLPASADTGYVKYLGIALTPIEKDETIVLKNLFFDYDRFELKPESETEIRILTDFLKANPKLKVEIGGHTDNTGKKEHNLELSTNRAKAVWAALTEHGIDKNRLTYKGYADTKPIADNATPKGRATNRRTELRILERLP